VSVVLLTRATFCVVLICVICVFCLLVVLVRLSIPVQVIDWKEYERLVSEMTYNVLMGTLNPTHSLTHQLTNTHAVASVVMSRSSVLTMLAGAGARLKDTSSLYAAVTRVCLVVVD